MRRAEKSEATTRITLAERRAFTNTLDGLISRHRLALPCPLAPLSIVRLWTANMNDLDRQFWEAGYNKLHADKELPLLQPRTQGVLLSFEFANLLLQIPDNLFDSSLLPFWDRRNCMSYVDPRRELTPTEYEEFAQWAKTAVHIHVRTEMTRLTLYNVLNMANTVGQLNRMAPELVQYTSKLTQQALATQERRSPLPEGWMEIDRMVLRASLDHLTFCYLLPPMQDYSGTKEGPWMWDAAGARSGADYASRPDTKLNMELSTYMLPFDPNPMELGVFKTKA